MIFFISASFLLGFFNIGHLALSLSVLYILCYILNGVLAPIWNPETPYIASYFMKYIFNCAKSRVCSVCARCYGIC